MMEAQIILAMVAQRFRLDLVPGHAVEIAPHITLRQKGGIRMALHTRQHATAAIRNASRRRRSRCCREARDQAQRHP